jgi:hypothetical protein
MKQIDDFWFTTLCLLGCKETPVAVTNGSKIAISYPLGLFVRVSPFSPAPEVFKCATSLIMAQFLRKIG